MLKGEAKTANMRASMRAKARRSADGQTEAEAVNCPSHAN